MYHLSIERLQELGAAITAAEIKQQPSLWKETLAIYESKKRQISEFLSELQAKHEKLTVIFAGAGTSAYVGDTILPYLKSTTSSIAFDFHSIPTTDLVSQPDSYFKKHQPTILVSFARSGNSPESLAAVEIGKEIVIDFYQITITCAPEGKLAKQAQGDDANLLLMMPEKSNDKGFAMTGSYSSMALASLLVFDPSNLGEKKLIVDLMVKAVEEVLEQAGSIHHLCERDFDRVIYLGSGSHLGASRESSLKLLELTAGRVATLFDTPMGFRHGPKSFLDQKTLVFLLGSNHPYTSKYDEDILNEIIADGIAIQAIDLKKDYGVPTLPDAYQALVYVVFAQLFSVMTAIKLGNKPDTPSPTGTVNRVVQGVTIHSFQSCLEDQNGA